MQSNLYNNTKDDKINDCEQAKMDENSRNILWWQEMHT